MPDPWSSTGTLDEAMQLRLADVLRLRAEDPQQREMADRYLSELKLGRGAKVLEVGCGVGIVARRIAELHPGCEVLGVDPSPVFVSLAREKSKEHHGTAFETGDGRSLNFRDESFDAVVFHTTLCHIPEPLKAIREAKRVLKPNGTLCAFDGDYVSTTVATTDLDPLQTLVTTTINNFVENRWLTRQLPRVLRSEGLEVGSVRSHGFVQTMAADYMLTLVERGADLLAVGGNIAKEAAEAFKNEARRRVREGEFFGHIAFLSVLARKA